MMPASRSKSSSGADATPLRPKQRDTQTLALVAVEVWRLGRRLEKSEGLPESVRNAYERMTRLLEDGGIEIRDPYGGRFIEGSNAEVIGSPQTETVTEGELIVTDVLRPGIFVGGVCEIAPQVVLGASQDDGNED